MIDLVWTGLAALALLWPSRFVGPRFFRCLCFRFVCRRAPRAIWQALRGVSWRRAGTFLGIFAGGVVLFMTRTWYYTGVFSLFYGTSLRHNDTGLRPWTLFDGGVWAKMLAAIGGTTGAFLAHAHGYPGRFSIHLIPFACALTMCGAALLRR